MATQKFLDGEVDEVYVIYTHFKSALSQEAKIVKMLPIDQDERGRPRSDGRILVCSQRSPGPQFAAPVLRSVYLTVSFSRPVNSVPYDGHDVGYGQRRSAD